MVFFLSVTISLKNFSLLYLSFRKKQMDYLTEVYPELNVPTSAPNDVYSQEMGSDTHGIVRNLGKEASPSLVYGPVYKRSQAEKIDFDTRVEMEVQEATSAMKIEVEAMDKKLLQAKEEAEENNEVMERKLSEAKMDMEEIIAEKVKEGIQAYVQSLGINIDANLKLEQVLDNPLKDCQQPSSLVPGVHTRKSGSAYIRFGMSLLTIREANMIKKTGTTIVGTNKNKWEENSMYIITAFASIP
ncbi:hypothetical protein RDI58_024206 [Solanum bulbocastanum]|uniref:Uncharacterized protein n=1 Tax=Solanum bulbocastanum TaxID=147425 RepID=A0AAN8Y334_SOLBU